MSTKENLKKTIIPLKTSEHSSITFDASDTSRNMPTNPHSPPNRNGDDDAFETVEI